MVCGDMRVLDRMYGVLFESGCQMVRNWLELMLFRRWPHAVSYTPPPHSPSQTACTSSAEISNRSAN